MKKYIEKELKINTEKEKTYFDEYNHADLENVIDTQYKLIDHMKKQEYKKLYNILIVIDDFADNPSFTRHSKLLHSLYTRGRHLMISTITSTQVFNALSPIIRKNITQLYVYKLRNYKDLEAVLEELSALTDKKTLLEMYKLATDSPHSFWYINLIAKKIEDMFFIKFNQRLLIE